MNEHYYQTLKKLENIVSQGNPYWNIDKETGNYLRQVIRNNQYTTVLEIGTSIGVSALYMVEALADTNGHITTVESHAGRYNTAASHFAQAQITKYVTQVKGHAPEVLDTIPGMFDMMFFDATKMEHVLYYTHLKDRLHVGGTLIADNAISHQDAMKEFLETIQSDQDFNVHIEHIGTGLLVAYKK